MSAVLVRNKMSPIFIVLPRVIKFRFCTQHLLAEETPSTCFQVMSLIVVVVAVSVSVTTAIGLLKRIFSAGIGL